MRIALLVLASTLVLLGTNVIAANQNQQDNNGKHKNMILADSPPGLQKKGMSMPPNGKVPPGWDEGLKKGWNKNKNWRWNKDTNFWENKNWRWDNDNSTWVKTKGWKK